MFDFEGENRTKGLSLLVARRGWVVAPDRANETVESLGVSSTAIGAKCGPMLKGEGSADAKTLDASLAY